MKTAIAILLSCFVAVAIADHGEGEEAAGDQAPASANADKLRFYREHRRDIWNIDNTITFSFEGFEGQAVSSRACATLDEAFDDLATTIILGGLRQRHAFAVRDWELRRVTRSSAADVAIWSLEVLVNEDDTSFVAACRVKYDK